MPSVLSSNRRVSFDRWDLDLDDADDDVLVDSLLCASETDWECFWMKEAASIGGALEELVALFLERVGDDEDDDALVPDPSVGFIWRDNGKM